MIPQSGNRFSRKIMRRIDKGLISCSLCRSPKRCSACSPTRRRLPAETVPLHDALGRVLTEDVDGAAHAAAGRRLRHGWLCRARSRRGAGAGQAHVDRRSRRRPSVRRHGRRRTSRAHLHRRRDAGGRRHRGDPGNHRARGRHRHDSEANRQRPQCARPGHRFFARPGAAAQRPPAERPRPHARCRHEPSEPAGASPAQGGGARHRRRVGGAWNHAKAGRDRLFQRLCADWPWRAAKAPR